MEKDEIKKILSATPLPTFLEEAIELDLLTAYCQIINFSAGGVILKQGKKSIGMYVILDGTALATAQILGAGGTYIATLGRGNFIGEISLIDKGPCAISVIASSRVKCLLITSSFFEMLALFYPDAKYKLTLAIAKQVCIRLKNFHQKISSHILHFEMVTRSLFGEVIQSLTKPTSTSLTDSDVNIESLQKNEFFKLFSKEEFAELLSEAVLLKAPKQCTIIQEQEKNCHCYILLAGAIQSSIVEENKIVKLSVLGPLSLFSSITCVDGSPSIIRYTTCERVLLIRLPEIEVLKSKNIKLWYKVFDMICIAVVALERAADKLEIRLNSELYNR